METASFEEDPASLVSENTESSGLSGRIENKCNAQEFDQGSDVFKDSDCGEPLMTQHLVLDFTPTGEDTDYIQRKCCAFWEFVNKQPELEGVAASTDLEISEEVSESGDYEYVSSREEPKPSSKLKTIEKTAVSMLELVEGKGLIDRAFESRLPTSHCSVGLASYEDHKPLDTGLSKGATSVSRRLSISPSQRAKSLLVRKEREGQRNAASPSLRNMCLKLREWDEKHPKCMKPPGPAPPLNIDIVETPAPAAPATHPDHHRQCSCKTARACRMRTHLH